MTIYYTGPASEYREWLIANGHPVSTTGPLPPEYRHYSTDEPDITTEDENPYDWKP